MISICSVPGFFTTVKSSCENISVMSNRVTSATISATANTIATSKRLVSTAIGSWSSSFLMSLRLRAILFLFFVKGFDNVFQYVHVVRHPALFYLDRIEPDRAVDDTYIG